MAKHGGNMAAGIMANIIGGIEMAAWRAVRHQYGDRG